MFYGFSALLFRQRLAERALLRRDIEIYAALLFRKKIMRIESKEADLTA